MKLNLRSENLVPLIDTIRKHNHYSKLKLERGNYAKPLCAGKDRAPYSHITIIVTQL
jgi:hypothetical protein